MGLEGFSWRWETNRQPSSAVDSSGDGGEREKIRTVRVGGDFEFRVPSCPLRPRLARGFSIETFHGTLQRR